MIDFDDCTTKPRAVNGQFAHHFSYTEDDFPPDSNYWLGRMTKAGKSLKEIISIEDYRLLVEMYIQDDWNHRQCAEELEQLASLSPDVLDSLTECTCWDDGPACKVCQARHRLEETNTIIISEKRMK